MALALSRCRYATPAAYSGVSQHTHRLFRGLAINKYERISKRVQLRCLFINGAHRALPIENKHKERVYGHKLHTHLLLPARRQM